MISRLVLACAALLLATACVAQDVQAPKPPKKPKPPTGAITGTVYCADTNLPARGATIYLLQIAKDGQSSRSYGATDLEGRFAIPHVREGSYYVMAQLQGYLNPVSSLTQSKLQAMTDDERKALESHMAAATVLANQTAEVALRLERSAEIDGTVQYDDGSPAIGLNVLLKAKENQSSTPFMEQSAFPNIVFSNRVQPQTDDRGRFRVLGIAPGEYLVGVSVPTSNASPETTNSFVELFQSSEPGLLRIYAGNTARASAAKVIKIESGDDSKDVDITIPLSKLHTIRGHVVLKSTNQAPLAANITLEYADTHEQARAAVAPNGDFELHYVPEDSYVLQAEASSQPIPEFPSVDDEDDNEGFHSFGGSYATSFAFGMDKTDHAAETPLTVAGDIDNVTIAVPDPPKTPPQPEPSAEPSNAEQPTASSPQ
jgi:hypothetical protein